MNRQTLLLLSLFLPIASAYNTVLTKHTKHHRKAQFKKNVTKIVATKIALRAPITVKTNVSMNDSTNIDTGNIIKRGKSFIHNYGTNNTFAGIDAGNFVTTGTGNNAGLGVSALTFNTSGTDNTSIGAFSLSFNSSGNGNTAIGRDALFTNTIGNNNVAIGTSNLRINKSGNENIAIGSNALTSTATTSGNIAIGHLSMQKSSKASEFNTAIGYTTLQNNTGNNNTAVGAYSMNNATNSNSNVAIGSESLRTLDQGDANTALGYKAGNNIMGSNNIFIGSHDFTEIIGGNNNVYIGAIAEPELSEAGIIRIGSTTPIKKCFIDGIYNTTIPARNASFPVVVNSFNQLGQRSNRAMTRTKKITDESTNILALEPVIFFYNNDTSQKLQYGLLAEDVETILPELIIHEADGTPLSIKYDALPILLLSEMKKHEQDIDSLTELIDELHSKVQRFINKI